MTPDVRPIGLEEPGFAALLAEAEAGDGPFLRRLADEWDNGALRFKRAGEVFLGAFVDGRLAGIGGISHDPYASAPGLCRLRHVYVRASKRGCGIGAALVQRLLDHARRHFEIVRLSTQSPGAARLYERAGFEPVKGIKQTHIRRL